MSSTRLIATPSMAERPATGASLRARLLLTLLFLALPSSATTAAETIEADLLIVGGTESGCAAAAQAARMGVSRIVLVNDIDWLGGQFSGESLAAIDESTDIGGIRHKPPIPRHGAFKEIIRRIEADNVRQYGVARPGNTRVITTCRPADSARIFESWLQPFVDSGQLIIHRWLEPQQVVVRDGRVAEVEFVGARGKPDRHLRVRARLTIDASDWGDVIRLSGAAYEFGPDLKSKYNEPLAPAKRDGYPLTDMNPITYCMVIEETDRYQAIEKPPGYDPRNYRQHRYPKDPLWLYGTRRLVDRYHFKQIDQPDVLLLCFPAFDYPLDVWPTSVAEALEADEPGASKKNIVQLTPQQRRIVFADAKRYSLGFLHYLQTEVHDAMPDKTHSFRHFRLSSEFGSEDRLPRKPYVRESLRLKAMYMMRQQDTTGVQGDSANFASAMYHDGVAVWQFEYDFHPTKREFLDNGDPAGPWRNGFRPGRTWGPPYSGRSLFPLRSLIPERIDGLLGGQKNLGYSSIVSAAVRLHDASMAIGQASGAAAAIALKHNVAPRRLPFNRNRLVELQTALVRDGEQPAMLWPYRDLQTEHPAFAAVNLLAAQRCLPILADDVDFRAEDKPTIDWMGKVAALSAEQFEAGELENLAIPIHAKSRGEFAARWWSLIRKKRWKPFTRRQPNDADGDGIADRDDALALDADNRRPPLSPIAPNQDGSPGALPKDFELVKQFNFSGPTVEPPQHYLRADTRQYDEQRGFGWNEDLKDNHRRRNKASVLADTFVFTRQRNVWECRLPNGRYRVDLSVGDSGFPQPNQNVAVEGHELVRNETTRSGRFIERFANVSVRDGRLTIVIGVEDGGSNTCLNWVRIARRLGQAQR